MVAMRVAQRHDYVIFETAVRVTPETQRFVGSIPVYQIITDGVEH